jgi:uncharacterized protein (DUF302 family)
VGYPFAYTVCTPKAFDDAVAVVERKVAEKGMRVQHVHDVQATLASKGYQIKPLKIIEVCDAPHAHAVLSKDVMISLMMPCKINVFVRDGTTWITALRPTMLAQFFPEAGLDTVAREVDAILVSIVDEAA